jgi:hypothetical protein
VFLVRAFGLGIVAFGSWLSYRVVEEGWHLYRDPAYGAIERFGKAIEDGAHLDATVRAFLEANDQDRSIKRERQLAKEQKALMLQGGAGVAGVAPAAPAPVREPALPQTQLSVAYLAAWSLALVLLFVIGLLSLSILRTGAEIVLYDRQGRRAARELLAEALLLRDEIRRT